jgi:hypothetical protein
MSRSVTFGPGKKSYDTSWAMPIFYHALGLMPSDRIRSCRRLALSRSETT